MAPPPPDPDDGRARFAEWYDRDWPKLVLFAIRLGAGQQQAQDLVQDATTEAFVRRQQISNLGGYVRVSIRNAYFRSVAGARWENAEPPSEDLPAPEDPSIGSIELADRERRVFAAIRQLSQRQREVMAWTIDGYQPREIAELVDATPGAVRVSLSEARKRLKDRLLPGLGGED
ncbi:RNA polymerase sigma-70 factor, ECF subfamily [Streptomyces sp. cf386]|uniref:RNA polymerase sigma factor n=1 Tax=Streptomyces sp. cf386 TaxID=1761904 RepID=UPI00087EB6DD|nr:sigma-70 family RNA polymerase sigma factor [Streptomyces sp. cf386]SDP62508.1 RNA polymerase sigma-70 factor, ECF subfamily [Streptomyces sp. cf386]